MKIKELLKDLDVSGKINLPDNFEVAGISCYSKLTRPFHLFVAVKGAREDGARYIEEAVKKGARAVITEDLRFKNLSCLGSMPLIKVKDARKALADLAARFFHDPSSRIKVVGITGTNGKTTLAYLLEALLKKAGAHPAVIGTINHRFKGKILPSRNTTPGPLELQPMLVKMLKQGADYCVMEVSSHALHQERVRGVRFHSAIFTNLTQDHLDYHLTMEAYSKCKARLFKNLSSQAFAVINHDDNLGMSFEKMTRAKVITYGLRKGALVTARDVRFEDRRTLFKIAAKGHKIDFVSNLIGRHNVYNILGAFAWALGAGIDLSTVKEALEEFGSVPGRLERVETDSGRLVFIDYAHTPDALKNVLSSLRQVSRKRIILVFGCGGERDRTKRPKMGRIAAKWADRVIITSDNPRSEEPREIIEDIKRGIRSRNFCVIPDRRLAILKGLSLARPGDIVLVAGKGHENYQVIKGKTVPFDDKEVVLECLKSRNY
jgi:UDP-N-acetylmuramoyl-L-alanyl-D-glutamate--2,6-diaminopimelate ligase